MPDPASLPLWFALAPVAAYLLGVAALHVRSCPTAVAGSWDLALLAATVAGLGLGGPLAVWQPAGVAGGWRWAVPLLALALLVAVSVLLSRPRLVIYNITGEQIRPVVSAVAMELDPGARWAGETVALPGRNLQVHVDAGGGMRTVSLVAVGLRTSPEAWAEFTRHVRRGAASLRVRTSPWAVVFAVLGGLVVILAAWLALRPVPSAAPPGVQDALPLSLLPSETIHAGSRRSFGA